MIKYRPHRLANSREFQSGIPGDWPQVEEDVPDFTRLNSEEIAAGFSLITSEQHQQILTSNRSAYSAWLSAQNAIENQDVDTKRTDAKTALDALEAARTRIGDFNVKQLSDFARLNARLWQIVIRNAPELFER